MIGGCFIGNYDKYYLRKNNYIKDNLPKPMTEEHPLEKVFSKAPNNRTYEYQSKDFHVVQE